jgi:hypothetical protein
VTLRRPLVQLSHAPPDAVGDSKPVLTFAVPALLRVADDVARPRGKTLLVSSGPLGCRNAMERANHFCQCGIECANCQSLILPPPAAVAKVRAC